MAPDSQRRFWWLFAMIFVASVIEVVMIGAVVPFLALVAEAEPAFVGSDVRGMLDFLPGGSRGEQIAVAAAVLMGAGIAAAIARLVLTWMTQNFTHRLGHDLGVAVFERMLRQPYSLFIRRNSSEVLGGIEKVQGITLGVFLPALQALAGTVLSAFIIVALVILDPVVAGLAALFLAIVYGGLVLVSRRRLQKTSDLMAESYGTRIKVLQEGLGAIRDILIDGSHDVFVEDFSAADDRFRRAQVDSAVIAAAPRWVVEGVGIVLVAAAALILSRQDGGLATALPILGALLLGAMRLLPLVQQIYHARSAFAAYSGLIGDIVGLINAPVRAAHGPVGETSELPFEHEITVESLGFAYDDDGPRVLDGIDQVVPKGARLGLVGGSGSGKSTLLDLLSGLLQPTAGRILIDGVPLDEANSATWQSRIANVSQSVYLTDASLTENIAFGVRKEDIDWARVHDAARMAEVDNFVDGLRHGYDTRIGERGVSLSGGQRQRIGIARALYKRPQVLILDEPTSALDGPTEALILKSLANIERDTTMIVVSHRPSTLSFCDRIVAIENGRLASLAPPD